VVGIVKILHLLTVR